MAQKHALITGASGLLGQLVVQHLNKEGFHTIGLRHRKETHCRQEIRDPSELSLLNIKTLDLVINLAGAPIAGGIWSNSRKHALLDSRVALTEHLISSLSSAGIQVIHFISASAIGYYGTGTIPKNEQDEPGSDFSALLCRQWEQAAASAKAFSQYVTQIRTGLVLSPNGGFLAPQRLPALLGLGTTFGDGQQGLSWIDYRDWLRAVAHIIAERLDGPVNLTSPNPIAQADFIRAFCQSLNRPSWLRIPGLFFKPLGEMKTLFIDGQFIVPKRLQDSGFEFLKPVLQDSLTTLTD